MSRRRSLIQVYAILINVVAVITFLIAATAFVSSLIDRSDPLYSGHSNVDLSSFEKYKMDVLQSTTKEAAYIPMDEEIRGMYEAAKAYKTNNTLHWTYREMMVSGYALVISLLLFVSHWMLMKRYESSAEG